MSTVVMSLGALQQHHQHRPLQTLQTLQPAKKMVMMLAPAGELPQPSNGTCVIVSTNGYSSPPHFTNLDSCAPTSSSSSSSSTSSVSAVSTTTTSSSTSTNTTAATNNNSLKAKNNNATLNKVSRVGGGAVQKRTSVVVSNTASTTTTTSAAATAAAAAEALRCKRRIQFSGPNGGAGGAGNVTTASLAFTGHQPASVARRNARERNRVKQVNNGFATLRSHIPPAIAAALQESTAAAERSEQQQRGGGSSRKDKEAAKKLSKVETLRMAVEYIRSLQALLSETSENSAPHGGPQGAQTTVKTEAVLADSPGGFDADYEAALALSHYSLEQSPPGHGHGHGHGHPVLMGSVHSVLPGMASVSPPCSDAGSSPTPSYVSDGSVGASSTGYSATYVPTTSAGPPHHHHHHHHPQQQQQHAVKAPHHSHHQHGQHGQHAGNLPATPPDSTIYEPMSPEDEELLDVISWWQQTN